MRNLTPTPPKTLNAYARELLDALAGHAEAIEIVLGGGVALSHYLEYRRTVDVDAWWRADSKPESRRLIHTAMENLAAKHGMKSRVRTWGDTESYELLDGNKKKFSFQISTRTHYIDAPVAATWAPVLIETLRDNVASKMTALVERGAPRDLLDIYQLCANQVLSIPECWTLWTEKNPGRFVHDGRMKVLFHVERLELQRPLEKIASVEERSGAGAVRDWFKTQFCAAGGT